MGEVKTYFFDTYAFYEVINGNKNYKQYEEGVSIITTKLNLMELHYGLIHLYGRETADFYYDKLLELVIEISDDIIKEANCFKFKHKRKKLFYVDCIGYIMAKKYNAKFLTGDNQFENLENVEFVK